MDVKIIWQTVISVIARKNINTISVILLCGLFIGCASDAMLPNISSADVKDNSLAVNDDAQKMEGMMNAVKKAHQMTDLMFTPLDTIEYNTGAFKPGISYHGLIYSSVKELETYVGENVSFHTFMTAVNNPRSKLYTERINQAPYHGINCKAYYGTVCSGLVSYALGLDKPRFESFDFPTSDLMEEIDYAVPENVQIADVLWKDGHVAMITDLENNTSGFIENIEISEAAGACCRSYYVNREQFLNSTMKKFTKVYRYKAIEKNTEYMPVNEFVAVGDEELIPFNYNQHLCVDKGDKSCYLEGEKVVINVFSEKKPYGMEIYKDNQLYMTYEADSLADMSFDDLPYGNYKARLVYNEDIPTGITPIRMGRTTRASQGQGQYSDFTYWKVVNVDVSLDRANSRVYFSSKNALPDYIICSKQNGGRPNLAEGFYHVFSEKDIQNGYVDVDMSKMSDAYPFIEIRFITEYGNIINKPINWYE